MAGRFAVGDALIHEAAAVDPCAVAQIPQRLVADPLTA